MKIAYQKQTERNNHNSLAKGIAFDLKNLLSTIKGKTILMKHRSDLAYHFQTDFNEILSLVEESMIRTELISIPAGNVRESVFTPVRMCD